MIILFFFFFFWHYGGLSILRAGGTSSHFGRLLELLWRLRGKIVSVWGDQAGLVAAISLGNARLGGLTRLLVPRGPCDRRGYWNRENIWSRELLGSNGLVCC